MPEIDLEYLQIRDDDDLSWHIFSTWTRVPGRALTVCERSVGDPTDPAIVKDIYPHDEKTCETCFRRIAK